jgi:very-short-patch-repair endonuclease
VFSAAQALAHGYTRDEVRARLASGRWQRVRRGIYRGAGDRDTYAIEVAGAVLACTSGRAVASHASAAHLHRIPLISPPRVVELTVPADALTTSVKGCLVHRGPLAGWRTSVGGIASTTLERTVVDLARDRPFAEAVAAADHALRHGATAEQLTDAMHRLRGTPGQQKVRRVVAFADGRSESVGESLARVVFTQHGLPAPELAQSVRVGGRLLGVVDFLWPDRRTAVEFDGRLKYLPGNDRGEDRLWHEKLREDALRDAGLEVVRLTWDEVTRQPDRAVARVRAAFARAERRVSAW